MLDVKRSNREVAILILAAALSAEYVTGQYWLEIYEGWALISQEKAEVYILMETTKLFHMEIKEAEHIAPPSLDRFQHVASKTVYFWFVSGSSNL